MTRIMLAFVLCLMTGASLAQCLPTEGRVGTSRTIVVDARGGLEVGTLQYPDTLNLRRGELVFTFDDGPDPDTTPQVLDILDEHCIKANFFLVGMYAERHPELVREIARRGHTIASHTYSHPILSQTSYSRAISQIERGEAAINGALAGTGVRVAPFFRFPGLNHTHALRAYLADRNVVVMSCDIGTDDWRRITSAEVKRRALRNIEALGSGMLIMHDTQPRTVRALPDLLDELAERGYTAAHMVPAYE